jgi:predicted nucleic acid-binding protein
VRLVVDASVAVKWFIGDRPDELHSAQARAVAAEIEKSETELFAPCHWAAEVAAVLARLDPDIVDDALVLLDDMKPIVVHGIPVLKRAADMSVALNHHLFDTLYHAVALEEGATLVTADEVYYGKAKDLGAIVPLAEFAL